MITLRDMTGSPSQGSPAEFVARFAELLASLVRAPDDAVGRERMLRHLEAVTGNAVTLTWDNWRLRANGQAVNAELAGLDDLLARMAAHAVRVISFETDAPRADLLGAARVLAEPPTIGDGGERATSRLRALGIEAVTFVPVRLPRETSASTVAATPAAVREIAPSSAARLDDVELVEEEPRKPMPAAPPASPTKPVPALSRSDEFFFGAATTIEPPEQLIARLQQATNVGELSAVLDAMVAASAESHSRIVDTLTMLIAVLAYDERTTHPEPKRVVTFALRRMATPYLYQRFATSFPRDAERHDDYMRVFRRGGADAVDALIDALVQADVARERRVLFDTLVELRSGIPTLTHLLGDRRWYVVRNAAELLGEMRAEEAESPLVALLRNADRRVRRSAAVALAKLGTPAALAALGDAMRDASADVRMQACVALTLRPTAVAVPDVVRALEAEPDGDVQRALVALLGRIGTAEAVRALVATAQPDRALFRGSKKPVALRVAAVQALGEIKSTEAEVAVRALADDREVTVREAAHRGRVPRKTGEQPGITGW